MRLFWSYARLDNLTPGLKVQRFKDAFATALTQALGRRCRIFFDTESITWGAAWRDAISQEIAAGDGLVAMVTPSYFNSRACVWELQTALEHGRPVYPVYFRNCAQLASSFKEDGADGAVNAALNQAARRLADFQMRDFRQLRNKPLDSEAVQDFIDEMAEALAAQG